MRRRHHAVSALHIANCTNMFIFPIVLRNKSAAAQMNIYVHNVISIIVLLILILIIFI